jgi:hypothetical protein
VGNIDNVFVPFSKIARMSRTMTVTEKLDGTSGCLFIGEDGEFLAGSRTRWITPEDDNFGFARWAYEHKDELLALGPGHHFGEWWGLGVQRKYDQAEKHFSLFNVGKWLEGYDNAKPLCPACCRVVPVLYRGMFDTDMVNTVMGALSLNGSSAAPGFMNPEGVVIYHEAARILFKKTFENDESGKGQ